MFESNFKRNVTIQVVGQIAPLAVGVLVFPILLHRLGDERFALLTLGWAGINQLNLLDFGVSKAVTRLIARIAHSDDWVTWSRTLGTALTILILLGGVGTLAAASMAPWISGQLPGLDSTARTEVARAIGYLAATLPLSLPLLALFGTLEAKARFDFSAFARGLTNSLSYCAPLLLIQGEPTLDKVALSLLLARMLSVAVSGLLVGRVVPRGTFRFSWDATIARELVGFGRWITMSSVIGPLLVYFDRLMVASAVSAARLFNYTTPIELFGRMQVIPSAFATVLYPSYARESETAPRLPRTAMSTGIKRLLFVYGPPCALLGLWSAELFRLWLGRSSDELVTVAGLAAAGMLVNGLAYVPLSILHGTGRPDLVAKAHLVEAIVYVPTLLISLKFGGMVGAAGARAGRMLLDLVFLAVLASRSSGVELRVDRITGLVAIMMLFAAVSAHLALSVKIALTLFVIGVGLVTVRTLWKEFVIVLQQRLTA